MESLGHITAAMDQTSWPPAIEPFHRLLNLAFDSRPKVRKAAQSALANVFAVLQDHPVWTQACDGLRQGGSHARPCLHKLLIELYSAYILLHVHSVSGEWSSFHSMLCGSIPSTANALRVALSPHLLTSLFPTTEVALAPRKAKALPFIAHGL